MAQPAVKIVCDSCVDLPAALLQKHGIQPLPLTVTFGNESFKDGFDISPETFYHRLRTEKGLPTTSQISPAEFKLAFERATADGSSAVYIGLSSGLSGCVQSALMAAQGFGDRVKVVDSLGASVGLGLMVLRAAELAEAGASADEIAADIDAFRSRMCHVFTLDTLEYAHRGGRVSTVAAVASRLLDVKAVLHMDMAGKLIPIDRAHGRKRSLHRLFEEMERLGADVRGKRVGVCHADAAAEAEEMAERFRSHYGAAEVVVGVVGATIGTHTGPGVISIFFEGPEGRDV